MELPSAITITNAHESILAILHKRFTLVWIIQTMEILRAFFGLNRSAVNIRKLEFDFPTNAPIQYAYDN